MRLTAKEDKFCIEFSKGINASDAYRAAYSTKNMKAETINVKASLLLKKGKIRTRIDELKKPVIAKAQLTFESHLKRLDDLSKGAEKAEQFSAAITAEIHRGKASGFYDSAKGSEDDAIPTPVKIEINVKDARVRDESESNA